MTDADGRPLSRFGPVHRVMDARLAVWLSALPLLPPGAQRTVWHACRKETEYRLDTVLRVPVPERDADQVAASLAKAARFAGLPVAEPRRRG